MPAAGAKAAAGAEAARPTAGAAAGGAGWGGLRVVVAAPPRSGLQSLGQALTQLGYRVYTGFDYQLRPSHFRAWNDWLLHGGPLEPVLELLAAGGWDVTADFPAHLAFRELAQRFPAAKVILPVRDSAERWTESYLRHIPAYSPFRHWSAWVVFRCLGFTSEESHADLRLGHFTKLTGCNADKRNLEGRPQDPQVVRRRCAEGYRRHVNDVQQAVPKERLLVFASEDGWAPLCGFLGVDAPPETPYPRTDLAKASWNWLSSAPAVLLLVSCWCTFWCCCRWRRRSSGALASKRKEQ